MPKPYMKLRHRMDEMDIDVEYIAPRLSPPRSIDYVRDRLLAHRPWSADDIVVLSQMLHIERDDVIPTFLPKLEATYAK